MDTLDLMVRFRGRRVCTLGFECEKGGDSIWEVKAVDLCRVGMLLRYQDKRIGLGEYVGCQCLGCIR